MSCTTRSAASRLSSAMNTRSHQYLGMLPGENYSRSFAAAAAGFALPAQSDERVFAVQRLDSAAFNVVIAAVEHLASLAQFRKISSHGVFYQFILGASGVCRQLV